MKKEYKVELLKAKIDREKVIAQHSSSGFVAYAVVLVGIYFYSSNIEQGLLSWVALFISIMLLATIVKAFFYTRESYINLNKYYNSLFRLLGSKK